MNRQVGADDNNDKAALSSLAASLEEKLTTYDSHGVTSKSNSRPRILICDAGYGLPREARPRKEKILAIARQLVNFIEWQVQSQNQPFAQVQVVACPDESVCTLLRERTLELLQTKELPSHVSFGCQSLEEACQDAQPRKSSIVYLSPDAEQALDISEAPPRVVIIGLLIDRKVQPNKSKERAANFVQVLVTKRWPLEECFAEISAHEPLNVDCIMEGMQQWWWNDDSSAITADDDEAPAKASTSNTTTKISRQRETFVHAAAQAIQHHAERHPSRPVHLPTS